MRCVMVAPLMSNITYNERMMKGLLYGAIVIIAISSASLVATDYLERPAFGSMVWGSFIVGTFVTAAMERRNKVKSMGSSLAIQQSVRRQC